MIKTFSPKLAALTAIAAFAALVPATAAATPHVARELVVAYEPGTSGPERERIRSEAGVESAGVIAADSQRVKVLGDRDLRQVAAELEANPKVSHARPNYVAGISFSPNDPGRGGAGQWAELQWNFNGPFGVGVPQAWQNAIASGGEGGKGVVVAVLDTGVAYRNSGNHRYRRSPDLGRNRFVSGYDFVERNRLPYDRNGHGTFIAGTVGQQTNNGVGVTGVAYRSRIMPVRVLDSQGRGDVATIARGIRFAARKKAQIVNMSFEFDIGLTASQIPDVISAVRYAHRKKALMVAASGNGEETRIAYPARARHVVAVGATTERGCLADYSNTGSGLDLVAPGGGADALIIGDPNCDSSKPGSYIYQYTFKGRNPRKFGLPAGYEGTSMAAPHVSGTAALIIAEKLLGSNPTPSQIRDRILATTRDLGEPGYDSTYGHGLLDAAAATAQ